MTSSIAEASGGSSKSRHTTMARLRSTHVQVIVFITGTSYTPRTCMIHDISHYCLSLYKAVSSLCVLSCNAKALLFDMVGTISGTSILSMISFTDVMEGA